MAIDIGSIAEARDFAFDPGYTILLMDNPANEAGIITNIKIYARTELSDVKVGTFYFSSPNFVPRSYAVLGTVAAGSEEEFTGLEIACEIGDFIGIYYSAGGIEWDGTGFDGVRWKLGDQFGAPANGYTLFGGDTLSVYGFSVEYTLHELTVTDGLQLTDTLVKTPMKYLSDGITLSDVLIKNPIKVLTDGVALTDVLEKAYIWVRTFTDSLAFTDTLIKSTSKVLSDGIAFTDTLKKLWTHGVLRILTAIRNLLSIREDGTKR